MSFPQTRHSLIERLSSGGDNRDWGQFLTDYWDPICRFARRSGAATWEDAEDVAAQSFEVLLQNQLLACWVAHQSAKLRTLLCAVARNVLSNQARVDKGRERLVREHGGRLDDRGGLPLVPSLDAPAEQDDAFYAAWVEALIRQAVDALLAHCYREGKGDYFRVLYGRVCDGLSLSEVARALKMETAQAENAYKQARQRLSYQLEQLVRDHVERYNPPSEAAAEFVAEWGRLGQHLQKHGELEAAVRRACDTGIPSLERRSAAIKNAMSRMHRPADSTHNPLPRPM